MMMSPSSTPQLGNNDQENHEQQQQRHQKHQYVGVFDKLSWRMNPSVSYSDWTIEIIRQSHHTEPTTDIKEQHKPKNQDDGDNNDDGKTNKNFKDIEIVDRYHVHRSVLAVGPRHSEYFAAQFQSCMQENVERTSRIVLEDARADVFPWLLDFMYSNDDDDDDDNNDDENEEDINNSTDTRIKHDISTPQEKKLRISKGLSAETAAALYNLAEYLDIPHLRNTMHRYYRDHLKMSNLVEYISAAQRHHADRLLKAAIGTCVDQLLDMDPIQTAQYLEPEFLLQVLEANNSDDDDIDIQERSPRRRRFGFHVSKLIAECGHGQYRDHLTRELFDKLTDKNLLPYMESKAAVRLLSLDNNLPNAISSEGPQQRPNQQEATPIMNAIQPNNSLSLSCLQQRCSQSITEKWQLIRSQVPANEELARALAQIPSHVLVDILMRATSELSLREEELDDYEKESHNDPPPRVLVDGSGTADVNGIYARDGLFQGASMYNKRGEYNGDPCLFSIFKCLVGSQTKRWFISVIPQNCRPGTNKDIDFYSALVTNECELIPPRKGWLKSADGVDPSPTILF